MAILRFFAGVMEHLDQAQAKGFLVHVLNPVHRITDESGDLASAQGEELGESPRHIDTSVKRKLLLMCISDNLRQLAMEVRDFVQNKVGVTDFSRVWENLRRHTTERREGRRQAKNQMVSLDRCCEISGNRRLPLRLRGIRKHMQRGRASE